MHNRSIALQADGSKRHEFDYTTLIAFIMNSAIHQHLVIARVQDVKIVAMTQRSVDNVMRLTVGLFAETWRVEAASKRG
jgi:hypothetical protein